MGQRVNSPFLKVLGMPDIILIAGFFIPTELLLRLPEEIQEKGLKLPT